MTQRTLRQWWRHLWLDAGDAGRLLGPGALDRLQQRVAQSEAGHGGQIRLCIEAGLPWRYLRGGASPRERALALFAKLRVWDTEHNCGVLIYLLQADRAIEIVADRGIDRRVDAAQWQQIVATIGAAMRSGRPEDGLNAAIDAVDALLRQHFPERPTGSSNELDDRPHLVGPGDDDT